MPFPRRALFGIRFVPHTLYTHCVRMHVNTRTIIKFYSIITSRKADLHPNSFGLLPASRSRAPTRARPGSARVIALHGQKIERRHCFVAKDFFESHFLKQLFRSFFFLHDGRRVRATTAIHRAQIWGGQQVDKTYLLIGFVFICVRKLEYIYIFIVEREGNDGFV